MEGRNSMIGNLIHQARQALKGQFTCQPSLKREMSKKIGGNARFLNEKLHALVTETGKSGY